MIKELNFDPDMEPEKKETWLSKIQKWWEENIYEAYIEETLYFFRKIKLGIKNLIEWFPIIWEDRHWDDKYIFDILQHKIKLQSLMMNSLVYPLRERISIRNHDNQSILIDSLHFSLFL